MGKLSPASLTRSKLFSSLGSCGLPRPRAETSHPAYHSTAIGASTDLPMGRESIEQVIELPPPWQATTSAALGLSTAFLPLTENSIRLASEGPLLDTVATSPAGDSSISRSAAASPTPLSPTEIVLGS